MLYFETHAIDPALAELTTSLSHYLHDRLIAPDLRPQISITIRLMAGASSTHTGLRYRDILAHKQGRGFIPPVVFDLNLAHQGDALATTRRLSHQWIHIAQIASGRYMLTGRPPKPNRAEKFTAHWLGIALGLLHHIPLAQRPWEVEANGWQDRLILEFINRFDGGRFDGEAVR